MPENTSYRVVQWTTGNVGRRSVRAIVAHANLELVGCYAYGEDKVGQDVGVLAGLDPIGVLATNDIDALLTLAPDCISYNPLWPDVDVICRLLEAGIHVATTAAFITGHGLGEAARTRIQASCLKGRAAIFGSGMNPGFANMLGLVSAGICDRIDRITVTESVDASGYASVETQQSVGFGHPITHPDLQASWHGMVGDRSVIELRVLWKMGEHMEPDWPLEHGYLVRVEGQPEVRTKLEIRPPKGFQAKSFEDFMQLGMIITSMPAINAIPHLCRAAPGIRGYGDLPLITGAGLVSTS